MKKLFLLSACLGWFGCAMDLRGMQDVVVEEFHEKYQDQVVSLILDIQQKEYEIPITLDQQPDLKTIPTFYQQKNGNFWIALDNNAVIGTIALLDIGNHEAALRKMFVHKKYRGTGVAKRLLTTLLAWAQEKNIKTIFLGTTPLFLAAHKFYEKNGFVEIPQEALPKAFPVMSVDKKFYKYDVKKSDV
jgi:N-acetylglutamate synthase-like GNAT family acetyltransferase